MLSMEGTQNQSRFATFQNQEARYGSCLFKTGWDTSTSGKAESPRWKIQPSSVLLAYISRFLFPTFIYYCSHGGIRFLRNYFDTRWPPFAPEHSNPEPRSRFFDRFSDIFRSINVGSRVGFPRRRRRRRGLLFCPEDLLQHTDKQIAAAAATGFPSPKTVPELANGGTRTLGEVRTGILIEN